MKLVTYQDPVTSQPTPGALLDQGILNLPASGGWPPGVPVTIEALIHAGPAAWEAVRQVIEAAPASSSFAHSAPHASLVPLTGTRLLSPLQPRTLRDAYAFEQHVRKANENRGRSVPPEWYQFPVFYFSNPHSIFGPGDYVPYPSYTRALDYELEIAAVIGLAGKDLSPEQAVEHIFGFTIFNDWSARDVQREEMKVGLGPAKGKDFASSLGPCIVTLDELASYAAGRPGVFDLPMRACVNGELRSSGNFKDLYWSFGEIIARVSEAVQVYPAEVIGSGTVGTGCLLELTRGEGPWLQPGDQVTLEVEEIGTLTNTIVNYI